MDDLVQIQRIAYLTHPKLREKAILSIAAGAANAGHLEAALEIGSRVPLDGDDSLFLGTVAQQVKEKVGGNERAFHILLRILAMTDRVLDERSRAMILAMVCTSAAQLADQNQAFKLMDRIAQLGEKMKEHDSRRFILQTLAPSTTILGDPGMRIRLFSRSLEIARGAARIENGEGALLIVIRAASTRYPEFALDVIDSLKTEDAKAKGLVLLCETIAKNPRKANASKLVEDLLGRARSLEAPANRAAVLIRLADIQRALGKGGPARGTLVEAFKLGEVSRVEISTLAAELGDISLARSAALEIENDTQRTLALSAILRIHNSKNVGTTIPPL